MRSKSVPVREVGGGEGRRGNHMLFSLGWMLITLFALHRIVL